MKLRILILSAILFENVAHACPRCWEKYQSDESFDFSQGNRPKSKKPDVNVDSIFEKQLEKNCQAGNTAACEQLVNLNKPNEKNKLESP